MSALQDSQSLYYAEREIFLQQPKNVNDTGDFEGTVKGEWVALDSTGLGEVTYKNKIYKTKALGRKSIAKGTTVALTYANGVYFADW
jgi:hypothetical protein